ncbi:hypothetical protein [Afipia felis]
MLDGIDTDLQRIGNALLALCVRGGMLAAMMRFIDRRLHFSALSNPVRFCIGHIRSGALSRNTFAARGSGRVAYSCLAVAGY